MIPALLLTAAACAVTDPAPLMLLSPWMLTTPPEANIGPKICAPTAVDDVPARNIAASDGSIPATKSSRVNDGS